VENTTLKHIAVSDNYMGMLGTGAIASALERNTGLRSLGLKNCELGDTGVERLCTALLVRNPGKTRLFRLPKSVPILASFKAE
jgi:Ran GTPase-activating protein (RanGAP) involved in mRNA processing and transport